MREMFNFYINGRWVKPHSTKRVETINPATEKVSGTISLGSIDDLNDAVAAANKAFKSFSKTSKDERINLLKRIEEAYKNRENDLIEAIQLELGTPSMIARENLYQFGLIQIQKVTEALRTFSFTEEKEASIVVKEPIGIIGLITPWNFPAMLPIEKAVSALAGGNTVVLKPSQLSNYTAVIIAEIIDAAGVPDGVFNLVQGKGSELGSAMSKHPDIGMISFTGSTEVGQTIAAESASTMKKLALELGGKSPFVILEDADLEQAAQLSLTMVFLNTGQICAAGSRTLVPRHLHDKFIEAVKRTLPQFPIGTPGGEGFMGPVVSEDQWNKVQYYIKKGMEDATLVAGGLGKPDGFESGYYVKPTVFTDVKNDMTIAQEEIFGPVMSIITYDSLDEAIEIANDTSFGLAGQIVGKDPAAIKKVASSIRAGSISINGNNDFSAPWGGYKMSGLGREMGTYGIDDHLETKAIAGYPS